MVGAITALTIFDLRPLDSAFKGNENEASAAAGHRTGAAHN
jgi:hypothetical protein